MQVSPPTIRVAAPAAARAPIPDNLRAPDTEPGERAGSRPALPPIGSVGRLVEPDAPAEGTWRLGVIGDFGTGDGASRDLARSILDERPELLLTVGDNVYEDGTEQEWRRNFDAEDQFGRVHREIAMAPALGNHDVRADPAAAPYFRRFPHLDGARYYSVDHKNMHVTVLDSNESLAPGTPQYEWLDRDLAQAKAGWKVLTMHHPMLSSSTDRAKRLKLDEYLGPLLAKHGVDLVFAGHDHNYERSKPLNEHGTILVRAGNGARGIMQYDREQPDWSAVRIANRGHVELDVGEQSIRGRMVRRTGEVVDEFTIERPASV